MGGRPSWGNAGELGALSPLGPPAYAATPSQRSAHSQHSQSQSQAQLQAAGLGGLSWAVSALSPTRRGGGGGGGAGAVDGSSPSAYAAAGGSSHSTGGGSGHGSGGGGYFSSFGPRLPSDCLASARFVFDARELSASLVLPCHAVPYAARITGAPTPTAAAAGGGASSAGARDLRAELRLTAVGGASAASASSSEPASPARRPARSSLQQQAWAAADSHGDVDAAAAQAQLPPLELRRLPSLGPDVYIMVMREPLSLVQAYVMAVTWLLCPA